MAVLLLLQGHQNSNPSRVEELSDKMILKMVLHIKSNWKKLSPGQYYLHVASSLTRSSSRHIPALLKQNLFSGVH